EVLSAEASSGHLYTVATLQSRDCRHSRNEIYGTCPDHSPLMLAARITLPHLSVSSAMSFPNSMSDIGIGSAPSCASRSLIFGSGSPELTSLLSLPMISGDVFFCGPTPHQLLTS